MAQPVRRTVLWAAQASDSAKMRKGVTMNSHFRSALLAASSLSLFLAGCVPTPMVLTHDALARIEKSDGRVHVPQDAVDVQFTPSGYGAGLGLVGVIVDASVNSALASGASQRADKLRAVVQDKDVRQEYWLAASNVLGLASWLKADRIELRRVDATVPKAEDVAGRCVANLFAHYSLSPDMRVFEMHAGLAFFLTSQHKKPAANVFLSSYSSEMSHDEGDKALADWTADSGAIYRRAASESISEQAHLLRLAVDLMGGLNPPVQRSAKIKARLIHGRAEFGIPAGRATMKGTIVDETDSRVYFRADPSHLYSLPRKEIEIREVPAPAPKKDGSGMNATKR